MIQTHCEMRLTCLSTDKARFEELGFYSEGGTGDFKTSYMRHDYAPDGWSGDMPIDIPYTGCKDAVGSLPAMQFACDGEKYIEVPANPQGYQLVVYKNGKVDEESLNDVIKFHAISKTAEALLY